MVSFDEFTGKENINEDIDDKILKYLKQDVMDMISLLKQEDFELSKDIKLDKQKFESTKRYLINKIISI